MQDPFTQDVKQRELSSNNILNGSKGWNTGIKDQDKHSGGDDETRGKSRSELKERKRISLHPTPSNCEVHEMDQE